VGVKLQIMHTVAIPSMFSYSRFRLVISPSVLTAAEAVEDKDLYMSHLRIICDIVFWLCTKNVLNRML